jgi:hypothetical protein
LKRDRFYLDKECEGLICGLEISELSRAEYLKAALFDRYHQHWSQDISDKNNNIPMIAC